ncbi:plasmid pRiA4b ORF-3 family protein [Salibacterium aidingense]|uniref:plasmid pRiA4b ORF-3 family protein n=1 Tax=Salibacterium aidingense TaxID=384933 RepID=UPI003BD14896
MLEYLGRIYGAAENEIWEEVLEVKLYQLKIQLNLEEHDSWRRVQVPSTLSFQHLHHVIQIVFNWQDEHLHQFFVNREKKKPINIVMDDDPATMDFLNEEAFEIRKERFTVLEDIFSSNNEAMYEYDFGDAWEHIITKEKVVTSNELRAFYLDGNGERPPEDIGGEEGFEEYLKIIADKNHPEHQETKEWLESQKEQLLTYAMIEKRLQLIASPHRPPLF